MRAPFYFLQLLIYVFYAGRCLRRAHPPEWLPCSFSGTPPSRSSLMSTASALAATVDPGQVALAQIQIGVNIPCELLFHHFWVVWSYGVKGERSLQLSCSNRPGGFGVWPMLPPPEPTSPNRPVPGPGEKQMRPARRKPRSPGLTVALRRPGSPKGGHAAGRHPPVGPVPNRRSIGAHLLLPRPGTGRFGLVGSGGGSMGQTPNPLGD